LEAKVAGRGGVRAATGPTSGGAPSKSALRMTAPGHPAGASRSPAGTSPPASRESTGRSDGSSQARSDAGRSDASAGRGDAPAGRGDAPTGRGDASSGRGDAPSGRNDARGESPHRSTARGVGAAGPRVERGHPNAPGADDVPPSGHPSAPIAAP